MRVKRQFEKRGLLWTPRYEYDSPLKRYERYRHRREQLASAITFNQVSTPTSSVGASPTSFTITSSTGNVLVCALYINSGGTVSGLTDNAGGGTNTYVLAVSEAYSAGTVYIFAALSAKTGVTSVTVTHTSTGVGLLCFDFTTRTGGVLGQTAVLANANNVTSGSVSLSNCVPQTIAVSVLSSGGGGITAVSLPFLKTDMESSNLAEVCSAAYAINTGGTLTSTYTTSSGPFGAAIAQVAEVLAGKTVIVRDPAKYGGTFNPRPNA